MYPTIRCIAHTFARSLLCCYRWKEKWLLNGVKSRIYLLSSFVPCDTDHKYCCIWSFLLIPQPTFTSHTQKTTIDSLSFFTYLTFISPYNPTVAAVVMKFIMLRIQKKRSTIYLKQRKISSDYICFTLCVCISFALSSPLRIIFYNISYFHSMLTRLFSKQKWKLFFVYTQNMFICYLKGEMVVLIIFTTQSLTL
jgi:hypothetical protein